MTSNGWKQLSFFLVRHPLDEIIVCDACSRNCMYYLFILRMILRCDVSACFPGVKTVCFSKKKLVSSCRVHHDLQCPLLPTRGGITIDVPSNTAHSSLR